jgi:hypothetical protein
VKTLRLLNRCVEFIFQRRGRSTEARITVTKETPWDELSDEERDARLHERR